MMGYGNWGNMMNWGGGFGLFAFLGSLVWILVIITLILLSVYLWKQINKK